MHLELRLRRRQLQLAVLRGLVRDRQRHRVLGLLRLRRGRRRRRRLRRAPLRLVGRHHLADELVEQLGERHLLVHVLGDRRVVVVDAARDELDAEEVAAVEAVARPRLAVVAAAERLGDGADVAREGERRVARLAVVAEVGAARRDDAEGLDERVEDDALAARDGLRVREELQLRVVALELELVEPRVLVREVAPVDVAAHLGLEDARRLLDQALVAQARDQREAHRVRARARLRVVVRADVVEVARVVDLRLPAARARLVHALEARLGALRDVDGQLLAPAVLLVLEVDLLEELDDVHLLAARRQRALLQQLVVAGRQRLQSLDELLVGLDARLVLRLPRLPQRVGEGLRRLQRLGKEAEAHLRVRLDARAELGQQRLPRLERVSGLRDLVHAAKARLRPHRHVQAAGDGGAGGDGGGGSRCCGCGGRHVWIGSIHVHRGRLGVRLRVRRRWRARRRRRLVRRRPAFLKRQLGGRRPLHRARWVDCHGLGIARCWGRGARPLRELEQAARRPFRRGLLQLWADGEGERRVGRPAGGQLPLLQHLGKGRRRGERPVAAVGALDDIEARHHQNAEGALARGARGLAPEALVRRVGEADAVDPRLAREADHRLVHELLVALLRGDARHLQLVVEHLFQVELAPRALVQRAVVHHLLLLLLNGALLALLALLLVAALHPRGRALVAARRERDPDLVERVLLRHHLPHLAVAPLALRADAVARRLLLGLVGVAAVASLLLAAPARILPLRWLWLAVFHVHLGRRPEAPRRRVAAPRVWRPQLLGGHIVLHVELRRFDIVCEHGGVAAAAGPRRAGTNGDELDLPPARVVSEVDCVAWLEPSRPLRLRRGRRRPNQLERLLLDHPLLVLVVRLLGLLVVAFEELGVRDLALVRVLVAGDLARVPRAVHLLVVLQHLHDRADRQVDLQHLEGRLLLLLLLGPDLRRPLARKLAVAPLPAGAQHVQRHLVHALRRVRGGADEAHRVQHLRAIVHLHRRLAIRSGVASRAAQKLDDPPAVLQAQLELLAHLDQLGEVAHRRRRLAAQRVEVDDEARCGLVCVVSRARPVGRAGGNSRASGKPLKLDPRAVLLEVDNRASVPAAFEARVVAVCARRRGLHLHAHRPALLSRGEAPPVGAAVVLLVLLTLALLLLELRVLLLALLLLLLELLAALHLLLLLLVLLLLPLEVGLLLLLQPPRLLQRRRPVLLPLLCVDAALPLLLLRRRAVRGDRVDRRRLVPSVGPPVPEQARAQLRHADHVQREVRQALDDHARRGDVDRLARILLEHPRRPALRVEPQQPLATVGALDERTVDELRDVRAERLLRARLDEGEDRAEPPAVVVQHLDHRVGLERARKAGRRGGRDRPHAAHLDPVGQLGVAALRLVEGVVAHARALALQLEQVGDVRRAVEVVALLQHLDDLHQAEAVPRRLRLLLLAERAPHVAAVRAQRRAVARRAHQRHLAEPRGVVAPLLGLRAVGRLEVPLPLLAQQHELHAARHPLLGRHRPDGAVAHRLAVGHARGHRLQRAARDAPQPLAVVPHPRRAQVRQGDVLVDLLVVQKLDADLGPRRAVGRGRAAAAALLGQLLARLLRLLLAELRRRHGDALPPAVVEPKLHRVAQGDRLGREAARGDRRRQRPQDGARLPLGQRHAVALLERGVLELQLARLAAARRDHLGAVPRAHVPLVGRAHLDLVADLVRVHVLVLGQRGERHHKVAAAVAAKLPLAILLPQQHREEHRVRGRRRVRLLDGRRLVALLRDDRLVDDARLLDEGGLAALVPHRQQRRAARPRATALHRPREALLALQLPERPQLRERHRERQLLPHRAHGEPRRRVLLRPRQQHLLDEDLEPPGVALQLEHLVRADARLPACGGRRRLLPQLGHWPPLPRAARLCRRVGRRRELHARLALVGLRAELDDGRRVPPAGARGLGVLQLDATVATDGRCRLELADGRLGGAALGRPAGSARAAAGLLRLVARRAALLRLLARGRRSLRTCSAGRRRVSTCCGERRGRRSPGLLARARTIRDARVRQAGWTGRELRCCPGRTTAPCASPRRGCWLRALLGGWHAQRHRATSWGN